MVNIYVNTQSEWAKNGNYMQQKRGHSHSRRKPESESRGNGRRNAKRTDGARVWEKCIKSYFSRARVCDVHKMARVYLIHRKKKNSSRCMGKNCAIFNATSGYCIILRTAAWHCIHQYLAFYIFLCMPCHVWECICSANWRLMDF